MLRRIGFGVVGLGVAVYYLVGSFFMTTDEVGAFTAHGKEFHLTVDKFPDGEIYLSVWDQNGDVYASTDWFRPSEDLAFSCAHKDDCYIVRSVDEETGAVSLYRLSSDLTDQSALSDVEFQSADLHGFTVVTMNKADLKLQNVMARATSYGGQEPESDRG
jgi:phosphoribosyl-ATP pyrophosphohydrolase